MDTKEAFIDAYDRYADAIYRYCYFRVFSEAKAEELVQETFMRAWEYLGTGARVEYMRAFLYRVATNLIVDDSRKKKEVSLDALRESGDFLEPSEDGAEVTENKMFIREVREKIEELEEDDRAVFVMRYVDELEPKEIAEALEISPNLVSVRLHRIAKKIKSKL